MKHRPKFWDFSDINVTAELTDRRRFLVHQIKEPESEFDGGHCQQTITIKDLTIVRLLRDAAFTNMAVSHHLARQSFIYCVPTLQKLTTAKSSQVTRAITTIEHFCRIIAIHTNMAYAERRFSLYKSLRKLRFSSTSVIDMDTYTRFPTLSLHL